MSASTLTLYPPQLHSKDRLLAALGTHHAALDASATGTGKTVKAVEIARELGLPTIVICPKAIIRSWQATFEGQGVPFKDVINYEMLRTGKPPYIFKRGKRFEWDRSERLFIIFDEVHKCKGLYTQNASLLTSAKAAGFPVLLLSASAIEDPTNMRAIGYALNLHRLTDFFRWAQTYGCGFDQYKKLTFKGNPDIHLRRLNATLFPSRGHRLTRDDMGDYFTKTRIVTDPIDFGSNEKIKELCDELEAEMDAFQQKEAADGEDALTITKILRLRQKIELLKIPVLASMIADYREEGHSVAVFLNFRDSVEALAKRLTEPFARIEGGQTANAREQAIDDFQKNRVGIVIANIHAGGVGVSLHDVQGGHPRVALVSPTYSATDLLQTLGRVDRAGAKSDSIQRILLVEDTIEEKVAKAVTKKITGINIINEQPDEAMPTTTVDNADVEETGTEEPKHAEYSPSSLKYIKACPGFRSRVSTNPAAEMGTRIHEALETDDFTRLSDEEAAIANECDIAVTKILRLHGWSDKPYKDEREVRFDIDLGDDVSTFGTCDRLFTLGELSAEAIAVDYKTGRGAVDDAETNMQAKAYALGAFQRNPLLVGLTFYFVIPQRDEITSAKWTIEDLPALKAELKDVIKKAMEIRPRLERGEAFDINELTPGPKRCEYCAHSESGRCPAVGRIGVQLAKMYNLSGDFELPSIADIHGSSIDDPEIIAKYLTVVPVLMKWADGIKHRAWQLAFEQGLDLPGFRRASRKGSREITNIMAAWEAVKDTVSIEEFLEAVGKVSVTKYEGLIKAKAPKGKKTEAVKEKLGELFTQGALEHKPDVDYLARDN